MTMTTCRKRRSGAALCFAIALALLIVVLSGCATTSEVPVAVSCVKERPARPAFRTDAEILGLDDYRALLALRAERLKSQGYIGTLEDVVEVCANAPSVVTVP